MKTTPLLAVLAVLTLSACATPEQQVEWQNEWTARQMAARFPSLRGLEPEDQQDMAATCLREVMIQPAAAIANDTQIGSMILQCYKQRDWIR